ncbi:hypothetical protein DOTSEDRAFT_75981 [Dothistroma septosporum NZE10]|uniref:Uncharacterized protein n=1 Tax=Dothistroma septosporum (strain NZE10 / CBS 128990) TaxID=675120 RepID=M2YI35_DOTSN|nr:hypothetical protein DOTSEDRAFT_75981 [Dothistroma septosporum NZE10]
MGERARRKTLAATGMKESTEVEVKLERYQTDGNRLEMASSPPLPNPASSQDQQSRSSSVEPEDVEIGYKVSTRRRCKGVGSSTPVTTPSQSADVSKRLGGPLTPVHGQLKSDVDKQTACYIGVIRDLDLSDETVVGAIAGLVNGSLKDVVVSSNVAMRSKVPDILEQLRQHGGSALKCEVVKTRLQRAEAKVLARRLAGLFSDHAMLERVSDALRAVAETARATTERARPDSEVSARSTSARESSVVAAPAAPDSSQYLSVPGCAKTAAPDSSNADRRVPSAPRDSRMW